MELPAAFSYCGSTYSPSFALCGEFSHLVDSKKVLWGFHVSSVIVYNSDLPRSPTWQNCANVIVEDDTLYFLFGGAAFESTDSDCAFLLNVLGFETDNHEYILAIPMVPKRNTELWTSIGFAMRSPGDSDVPKAVGSVQ